MVTESLVGVWCDNNRGHFRNENLLRTYHLIWNIM
jgi:hypothetical protein